MKDTPMRIKPMALVVCTALWSGCAYQPTAIDLQFGSTVRAAIQSQTVNPHAPEEPQAVMRSDGQSTKSAIDRYQKSYDLVTPTGNVFNIGVGSGAGVAP